MPYTALPLSLFVLCICSKISCMGISFVDSTILDVCDSHKIQQHKIFEGIAKRGKNSTEWFYDFNLHLVIHEYGKILNFYLTLSNICNQKVMNQLIKNLFWKLFYTFFPVPIQQRKWASDMNNQYLCIPFVERI